MIKQLGEETTKALLTGAVSAVGSIVLFGETEQANLMGISLPAYLIVGGASAAGSWVSDVFSDNVIRMLPQANEWKHVESLAVRLGLAGGASALALKFTTGMPDSNLIKSFGLGAASKAAGEWTFNNVVNTNKSGFLLGF